MKLILFLIPIIAFAGFSDLPGDQKYQYGDVSKIKKRVVRKRVRIPKNNGRELKNLTQKIMDSDLRIEKLLQNQEKQLIVRSKGDKIKALTRVRGVVLNSILAMNIKPTTFIVRLNTSDIDLEGGELRCQGMSFHKRVPAFCDLLVTDDSEFQVDVKIWDVDGAEGIIADHFYSGEEKSFITSSFVSFFQGVLDAAKDRILTPFGDAERNNAKNKVLGGLMGVAGNANQKISESAEKNISIAFVNAGKEVLVFFNKSLNLKEKR